MNIELPQIGFQGQFRCVVSSDPEMQDIKEDTGFFTNLITDVGMNRFGTAIYNGYDSSGISNFQHTCGRIVVGSGSKTPEYSDTALQSPVAMAPGSVELVSASSSYEDGYMELSVRQQFGQGQAAGNLSEIGIQHSSLSGPLWSRALILDGSGNPTTITVLEMDFLTCYYTIRLMIPKEDAVFSTNVDVDGVLIPTTVTIRPNSANSSSPTDGWGFSPALQASTWGSLRFYSGGLSAPTALSPLGTHVGSSNSKSLLPYVPDSFELYMKVSAGLNTLNSDTLQTAVVPFLTGAWQVHFDPPLQKNNTQTAEFTFGTSWARA